MKFSMNGWRLNLIDDVVELKGLVEAVIAGDDFDQDDLIDAMNNIICQSNTINCVFVEDDPDFTNMADLKVENIEVVA